MADCRVKIIISNHAMRRLKQRLPELDKKQYNTYVSNARYLGITISNLPEHTAQYLLSIKKTKNTVIRIYKDNVFIFRGLGNGHQLITVFPLKERFK